MTRKFLLLLVPVSLLAGLALARGRKTNEAPPPPETPVEAPTPEAPPPDPAPPLFPSGLPVTLTQLPPGLSSLSAQGCNGCHYAAHDTWEHSKHATAWSSPLFQEALRAAGDSTACLGCHLPLASQHDQLANGYVDGDIRRPMLQPNPGFDLSLRGEGVTCAACHVRDGVVVGTHSSTNAPHPVKVSAELGSPDFCATCHQLTWPGADRPYYDTWGEWKASAWSTAGVTCSDCHMVPTAGVPVPGSDGSLPSHAFLADPRRAVSVLLHTEAAVAQRGKELKVDITLQNTGAGHAFPTGNPQKAFVVQVQPLDSAGKAMSPPFDIRFERITETVAPYKTTADTRLAAGGERKETHVFPLSAKALAGRGSLEVRLLNSLGGETVVLQKIPMEFR